MRVPRLRSADKIRAPHPLGLFSKETILSIGSGIVYSLHTRGEARLEGSDWEQIFANAIGANWSPSNIGLDDVRLDNCCWGAKTVKNTRPDNAKKVRLISGRNSLDYSYDESSVRTLDPNDIGKLVLQIWNSRVSSVRQRFAHCRTVVLIKSNDLSLNAVFEIDTIRYEPELYTWNWNANRNLEGSDSENTHKFTWQPHGSQFTIIEAVPDNRVAFKVKLPEPLPKPTALAALGFTDQWITILD